MKTTLPRVKRKEKIMMANPNVQDAINKLSVPPLSQVQQPIDEDPTMIANTSTAVVDTGQVLPRPGRSGRISSMTSFGQDQIFNEVCNFLTNKEVGMVGIYGMGGVGKTTIMKKIRKEFLESLNYKIIWLVISKSIDVDGIQKDIMEEMDLCFNHDEQRHKRAKKISNALENEKVALLFDDIWEFFELEELGILGHAQMDTSLCKIIFSTRSERVCSQMKPHQKIKVECLGWDDSWALFERSVGKETLESHPRIPSLAKEVAQKYCKGLPLALTMIGRAMTCKYTPEAWKCALSTLENSPSEVRDAEEKMFATLKFSYDALPDSGEKDCFLSCCLYPQNENISCSELVKFWIANRFFTLNGSYVEALNRGYDIIGTMLTACLLERSNEDDDASVRMHDVVRDMGLWISAQSKINFFVHGGSCLTKPQIAGRWREAHGIFVLKEHKFPKQPRCLNLTTLIINYGSLRIRISNDFFKSMGRIRVLELHGARFLDLPVAIGQLRELRYLGIHGSDLKTLPMEMGNLSKLEVLHLCNNMFRPELPSTIGQLVELRSLRIIPYLKAFPVGLQNLDKLEILSLEFVGNHFQELSVSGQVDFINGLRRLPHSLRRLCLDNWPITSWDEVLSTLQNMEKLSELCIGGSPLKEFVVLTNSHLSRLEELRLTHCIELEKIQLGQMNFQKLRKLEIRCCTSLKFMIGLQHLQGLVELTIKDAPEMEELIKLDEDVKDGCPCFPHLKAMTLSDLGELKSICSDVVLFPSLTLVSLSGCPKLKKLPRGLMKENRALW